VGDTLLVVGRWKEIERLSSATADLLVLNLPAEFEEVIPVAGRAPHALLCLAIMVSLMVSGIVPSVQAALIACLLMGALGCIDLESAYRSIHWKSLVLIVGMLPFSIALQKTGGVELAAEALMAVTSGAGPYGVLASLFAITALLGLFISNTATAVLMAPVALAMAGDLGASPHPFAMTVALAVATIRETDDRAILQALVIGGFAQILVASLAYLGPVLRGGGHRRLTAGFATTRSWVSLAAGNTAALAALVGHGPTLAAALAIWLTDVAIRAGRLLTS
jgi:hypothetical protein